MSLPSGGSNFNEARIIDWWREYPFSEKGSPNQFPSIRYVFKCQISNLSYTELTFATQLDDAATAGVIQLPLVDANAYFIGDTDFQSGPGGTLMFTRTFARIPATWTDSETVNHTFVGYREWVDRSSSINAAEQWAIQTNDDAAPTPPTSIREPLNRTVTAKITYTYHYSTNGGVSVSLTDIYNLGQIFGPSKILHVLNNSTYTNYVNCPALDTVNYACDQRATYRNSGEGNSVWPATTPNSLTSYKSKVSSGNYLVIGSEITQYGGNIYQRKNTEVKAL